MGLRIRRTRITCLTIALLLVAIFIVLNVFSMDVNSKISSYDDVKYLKDSGHLEMANGMQEKSNFQPEFQVNFAAQGQRKPKTMNMGNGQDEETDEAPNKFHVNKLKLTKEQRNKEDIRTKGDLNYQNSDDEQEMEDIQDLDEEYENEDDDDDDEYDYDDEYNPNSVFKPGDFGDIRGLEYYQKPKLKYETVKGKESGVDNDKPESKKTAEMSNKMPKPLPDVVQNGLFWSSTVEAAIPKGLSYRNITKLIHSLHNQAVHTLDDPTWDRCGRPRNGFIILGDGTQMCVRYRHPHDHFVYGEALSFYLSRLLGMDNVPAVVLAITSSSSRQWRAVNISTLDWEDNKIVAFIQWIDNLNSGRRSKAYIPPLLAQAYHSGIPVQKDSLYKALSNATNRPDLTELAQWGSMIIFDYLTGNYDRVASMQDAADKDENPHIMEESIRNLRKSSQTKKLWLIDNESGLFDAYALLEEHKHGSRFIKFHKQMLQTMCIFQSSLVNALYKLSTQPSPHARLLNFASSLEPLLRNLPKDKAYDLFQNMFENRLQEVISWIETCKKSLNR